MTLMSQTGRITRHKAWEVLRVRLFPAAFFVSAVTVTLAIFLTTTTPGSGVGKFVSGQGVFVMLSLNAALDFVLAALVLRKASAILFSKSSKAGIKLHKRFVALFAASALIPALIVALFFGLLVTRTMDDWFSKHVRSAVEGGAVFGNAIVNQQVHLLSSHVGGLAKALNRPEAKALLQHDPKTYSLWLAQALDQGFAGVYILDNGGRVLAKSESSNAPLFRQPSKTTFNEARIKDEVQARFDPDDVVRALYRLSGSPQIFLYVMRPLEKGLYAELRSSEASVREYKKSLESRTLLQAIFVFSYIDTVFLILIGAVSVGLRLANQIVGPLARLVEAAEQISRGNFSSPIAPDNDIEEIAILSKTFHQMSRDLETKQQALQAASQEAQERSQFIETVLEGVSAGVLGLDAKGFIQLANSRAMTLLAMGSEQLAPIDAGAKNAPGPHIKEVAPEIWRVIEQALNDRNDLETDIDIWRLGHNRRLRIKVSSESGEKTLDNPVIPGANLVVTFDDITRLVTAQRNSAWRDVAKRIAHEIKNPLTPIQLSAERLRRKYRRYILQDVETFDRCTETIIRQVGHIGRMVNEFSSFARMPAANFSRENATELLRQAVFAQKFVTPDIHIRLEAPQKDVLFSCDAYMVGQALANLLKNAGEAVMSRLAKDFGSSGGPLGALSGEPLGEIHARLKILPHEIQFEIEDNGIGLPRQDRHHLLEPYITKSAKGMGLGLAIVKRIMEEHRGEISLGDAFPQGAIISLSFPTAAEFRLSEAETHLESPTKIYRDSL